MGGQLFTTKISSRLQKLTAVTVIAIIALLVVMPLFNKREVEAASFSAGRIIDDAIFTKKDSMNAADVQVFLDSKNSTCLKSYQTPEPLGDNKYGSNVSAARAIWKAAQLYNLNPQVLLVTLQKEQGLVTRDDCPSWRYDTAMGFACPDGEPCNAEWFGLSKQLYQGARHLRNFYDQNPNWWIPFSTGTHFIPYHPNGGCGGTNVNILNGATAALYSYTPYQPNNASLDAGYGTGNACSSYGNRNFWLYFNDWFGSPLLNISIVKSADNSTLYLREGNTKRAISSWGAFTAWGYNELPILTLSEATINSLTTMTPNLNRTAKSGSSSAVYFADDRKHYHVSNSAMADVWQIDWNAPSLGRDAFALTSGSGRLSYLVKGKSNNTIYLRDQGTIYPFSSINRLNAWEGTGQSIITLSDGYIGSLSVGEVVPGNKANYETNNYIIDNGGRRLLSSNQNQLFNAPSLTVSQATFNRLRNDGNMSHIIKGNDSNSVYLIENGQKHPISSLGVLSAWAGNANTLTISSAGINEFTEGNLVSGYLADNGGELYIIDGSKRKIPVSLDSAYRTGDVFSVSPSLLNTFTTAPDASGFIKGKNSSSIYLMDEGKKLPIASYKDYLLLKGGQALTTVGDNTLTQFTNGVLVTNFISNGSINYAVDEGKYYQISDSNAQKWGFSNSTPVANATLARFTNSGSLSDQAQNGASFYKISNATAYKTEDTKLKNLWGITAPALLSNTFISKLPQSSLSAFVKSSDINNKSIYLKDNAELIPISSVAGWFNLGYQSGTELVKVSPAEIGSTVSAGNLGYLIKNGSNTYVIDNGKKRTLSSTEASKWQNSGATNVANVSSQLINYFPDGAELGTTIKGTNASIYAVDGGTKHPISSYHVYAASYAPYATVTDRLLGLIPTGSTY